MYITTTLKIESKFIVICFRCHLEIFKFNTLEYPRSIKPVSPYWFQKLLLVPLFRKIPVTSTDNGRTIMLLNNSDVCIHLHVK